MKGIIFTEFLEMVESQFGYGMVDTLLTNSDLPSKGIYTSVGTYSHREMVNLVANLGIITQTPSSELLRTFGRYLFSSFTKHYHHFIEKAPDAFTLLGSIHNYIHVEVHKLYPDAELPHFSIEHPQPNVLIMNYTSSRKMADLALGLIEGTLEYFNEKAQIDQQLLNTDGSIVKFIITKE